MSRLSLFVYLQYIVTAVLESIMYLYRATGDPWLIDAGLDILRSIQHSAYTPCGYATVKVWLFNSFTAITFTVVDGCKLY